AGAVAPPVLRAVVGHAAQRLRRHRGLQRVEVDVGVGDGDLQVDRVGRVVVHAGRGVGGAEVPGELVLVGEDVAARAGGVALRAQRRVVEEAPAGDDLRRLRGVQGDVGDLGPGGQVDDGDAVVEAVDDVELAAGLVEGE